MEATYASSLSTKHIWQNVDPLNWGSNLLEFHSQFLNLTKLAGETMHNNRFGNTSSGSVRTFAPCQMELESISQMNDWIRCGGKVHLLYFCMTSRDRMNGDPIKKPDFDKTKHKGKGKEKGDKGCGRCGQNNATEVQAATSKGTARGTGVNGGGGNSDDGQVGNA
jgi:hypothetical protein